jgi:hypothetical protein
MEFDKICLAIINSIRKKNFVDYVKDLIAGENLEDLKFLKKCFSDYDFDLNDFLQKVIKLKEEDVINLDIGEMDE